MEAFSTLYWYLYPPFSEPCASRVIVVLERRRGREIFGFQVMCRLSLCFAPRGAFAPLSGGVASKSFALRLTLVSDGVATWKTFVQSL